MRPYIIINGMNSSLVDGLLISDLPDIKKPQMRSNQIEIDGRDGDIVQPLGYSSYDKEITIGLYGKYDIDRVIRYFNDSGEVIFSNEPDKVYKYTILDEISYEKLNRFRKAKVTFHVQPFKHSAMEKKVSFTSQLLKLGTGSKTENGLTLSWDGHNLSVSGTATAPTRFMIPINLKTIAGTYTVTCGYAYTGSGISYRICNAPIDSQSLGGGSFSAGFSVTESRAHEYHYLAVEFTAGGHLEDMSLTVKASQMDIVNRGNVNSRPLMNVYGSGQITLSINGTAILVMEVNDGYITIDGEGMNAYKGDVLYNRAVLGNYANVVLQPDHNIISWSGNLTKIEIDNYSRWI